MRVTLQGIIQTIEDSKYPLNPTEMDLWLKAAIADALQRIAAQLEGGQFSILEAETITAHLKSISDKMPG